MSSKKIIGHFRRISFWAERLDGATACWRAEEAAGIKFTEEERKQLHDAHRLYSEARKIFSSIYAKRIGDAVVAEVRS